MKAVQSSCRVLCGALVVLATGCVMSVSPAEDDIGMQSSSFTNLFGPVQKNTETNEAPEQKNAKDAPDMGSGLGDRCAALDLPDDTVRTPSKLTLEFETTPIDHVGKEYGPKNAGAAWLELLDPSDPLASEELIGRFIVNLDVWVDIRHRPLNWSNHACRDATVDVMTSATLTSHRAHSVTWNGLDFEGNVAADGDYALWIEVTESDLDFPRLVKVPFTKGPTPFELMPEGNENITNVRVTYTP